MGGARLAACTTPAPAPPPTTTTTATTRRRARPRRLSAAPPVSVVQTDAGALAAARSPARTVLHHRPTRRRQVIDVNDQLALPALRGPRGRDHRQRGLAHLRRALGRRSADVDAGAVRLLRDPPQLPADRHGRLGRHDRRAPYSYDDQPSGQTDPTLADFSIAHDQSYIIPTLQQALSVNPGLEILANPWSPPGWMKSNDSLGNQNDSGTLISSDYQVLADYFVKTIQDYAAHGVPIDAITPRTSPGRPARDHVSRPHAARRRRGAVHRAGSRARAEERRPGHQDLRQRPELGLDRLRRRTGVGPERRPGSGRHRLALLLRRARRDDPARAELAGPRSDRR